MERRSVGRVKVLALGVLLLACVFQAHSVAGGQGTDEHQAIEAPQNTGLDTVQTAALSSSQRSLPQKGQDDNDGCEDACCGDAGHGGGNAQGLPSGFVGQTNAAAAALDAAGNDLANKITEWCEAMAKTVQERARSCFPADALVRVEGRGTVPMQQLKHGDRVLAVMPNGELGYDQVYLFGHKDPRALATFVVITTAANSTLRATEDHFMHVVPAAKTANGFAPSWSDMVHMPAQHVKAGDYLFNVELGYAVKVTQVQQQVAKGLYNPYTMSGNIVVDGYSASTHSHMPTLAPLVKLGLHAPSLYQAALAPVRAVHRLHPGLLGYVDDMYSENGWLDVGVLDVLRAIALYQTNVVSA